jgi:ubiquinone/menaquinone biosynthesis C-methylase UbiE
VQGKPGTFTLDECRACGHEFQNPRLTPDGLDFYYRDFYDGLGEQHTESTFGSLVQQGKDRARMVRVALAATGDAPKRWLDVGCGPGHFARDAREELPDTTFDGLDMGVAVLAGAERGWLDHAIQGTFPELAPSLAGRYDVVSMHHYLEHTRDPKVELDAAAEVLPPGGLLLIEVPNPKYRFARWYRSYWLPLYQPQHQHLVPMDNLVEALDERGFTIVATVSGDAQIGVDTVFALTKMFGVEAPDPRSPWLLEGSKATRHKPRGKVVSGLAIVAGFGIDRMLAAIARRTDNGNAYRVLARKA